MPSKSVPPDEWVEVIASTFEDDYSIVVEDAPVLLSPGDKPARPTSGLPIQDGAIQSGQLDRGVSLWARSQVDSSASVRVVPDIRIDGSNERAVQVSTTIESNSYRRGGDFDSESDSFPIEIAPAETIQQILLPIVSGEILLEITTTDGDSINMPITGKATVDSYQMDSVRILDTTGTDPRVAGGWAGE